MALIPAKCTQCGANIQVDNTKEAGICESCGTAFITEKVINNYNITNNIHADVVNIINKKDDFEVVASTLIKYHGSSNDVVIPSNVSILAKGAFYNCKGLRSVYIPSSVTKIENSCFPMNFHQNLIVKVDSLQTWCNITKPYDLVYGGGAVILEVADEIIQTLILPEGIRHIKENAFIDCKLIKRIVFPKSLISIGNHAFRRCDGITELIFPSGVKQIGNGAFGSCGNLRKIYLPDTVVAIGNGSFSNCKSLIDVRLSNNMKIITDLAFEKCSYLRKIDIPEGIEEIGFNAFAHCKSLEVVNIGNPKCKRGVQAFLDTPYGDRRKGCYVATCVYGSYDCPQVWTLRRYRDDTLAATWYGRAFIRTYYAVSPTIVKWFGNAQWFKKMWRNKLDKMVSDLRSNGVEDTPYQDKDW